MTMNRREMLSTAAGALAGGALPAPTPVQNDGDDERYARLIRKEEEEYGPVFLRAARDTIVAAQNFREALAKMRHIHEMEEPSAFCHCHFCDDAEMIGRLVDRIWIDPSEGDLNDPDDRMRHRRDVFEKAVEAREAAVSKAMAAEDQRARSLRGPDAES